MQQDEIEASETEIDEEIKDEDSGDKTVEHRKKSINSKKKNLVRL